MSDLLLVGDVGGTNARFALSERSGALSHMRSCRVADHPAFEDALADYLGFAEGARGEAPKVTGAHVAAAGPVEDGAIALTNAPWRISEDALRRATGAATARVYNDLEAVAMALPHLAADDSRTFGPPPEGPPLAGNLLAVNVGTGFGVAAAVRAGAAWAAVAGESGHMTLAPRTPAETRRLAKLRSVEDVLSGAGLAALYGAIRGRGGASAADALAALPHDPAARETFGIFSGLLARVAGDAALALGAWGGVFLTGSVATAWSRRADPARFREVFCDKGMMAGRMRRVPVRVIVAAEPALFGLSHAQRGR